MRPIPKALLRHTILYHEKNNDVKDLRYHNDGYKDPITISNVCIQPSFSKRNTSSGEEKSYKSLLIIDGFNSSPVIKPIYLSKIVFDDEEMIVQNVKEFYDKGKLHHYEVDLT